LLPAGSMDALQLIREQIDSCESDGVEILCCPEAILGGLADNATESEVVAIGVDNGQLHQVLAPLASDTVTAIVGFTEIDRAGRLFNSAAVLHKGTVAGVYRKNRPAIRRSVYAAGETAPVFTIGGLTFGILICYDSSFPELARAMASQGAAALFVPSNNGLPPSKGGPGLVLDARNGDIARATENRVFVIRADVAGRSGELASYGSSAIVDRDGVVLRSGRSLEPDLLIAEIDVGRPRDDTLVTV
jgi:predicted amidohydrolase